MSKLVIGIDPGKKGAIAVLNIESGGCFTHIYDPRVYKQTIMWTDLENGSDNTLVVIEKVHAMPHQGTASMFSFGENYGFIKGILFNWNCKVIEVPPQTWKRYFGLSQDKSASIELAKKLFPEANLMATPRCRVPSDGIAEAILMAKYAIEKGEEYLKTHPQALAFKNK